MPARDESLAGRMDRIGVERLARTAGLPAPLAERVADIVVATGLPEDRRAEVFRELVGHFEDGLAAGRSTDELLADFGETGAAADLIRREKRVVTPEALGGGGSGDGVIRRLVRNVRYAVRRLTARPAFTATAVLSLALGIGANAAMFTLVNDVILRRPALHEPDRLADIYMTTSFGEFNPLSHAEMIDLGREAPDVFADVGGTKMSFSTRGDADVPEKVFIELVSGNFFRTLGVQAAYGRMIEPADAPAPGTGEVVVLSDRYWRRAFGADPGVIGRTIRVASGAYTVIGVAPPDYSGSFRGFAIDVFVPVTMSDLLDPSSEAYETDRGNHSTFTKARLLPGVTFEQARVALARIASDYKARRLGVWEADDAFNLIPVSDVIVWPPLDRVLVPVAWMLMVVVGLVLVIACANLAAFLLARAVDRRKEIAVRLALGASRGQLVSQLLVETVLLAMMGGAVGVFLGRAALRLVLAVDLPIPVPIGIDLSLDWRLLTFAVAVSVAAGALFGLAPALQSTRLDLASVIRDESTGGGRSKGRLRNVLVAGQVAVSVVLLVAAGLFVRSFEAARGIDPGFGGPPAALAWIGVSARGSEALRQSRQRIIERVAAVPGVRSVGAAANLHLSPLSTSSSGVTIDGVEPPPGRLAHDVDVTQIDTGFVAASGLALVEGRNFAATDADGPAVALVNAAFAERFWPGVSAVGRTFRRGEDGDMVEYQVIGVVATAKIRSLAEDPRPFLYLPMMQREYSMFWLVARTAGPADVVAAALLPAIREVDPDAFAIRIGTMEQHLAAMSLPMKLGAVALAAFALLALVMASVGLYGTVSYAVSQRSREVGIRLSLGADGGSVTRLLLWSGMRLVVIGAAVGLALAFVLARLLEGLLLGVAALDPLTFAAVPVLLVAVAALAAWVPARRAGRADPIAALRAE